MLKVTIINSAVHVTNVQKDTGNTISSEQQRRIIDEFYGYLHDYEQRPECHRRKGVAMSSQQWAHIIQIHSTTSHKEMVLSICIPNDWSALGEDSLGNLPELGNRKDLRKAAKLYAKQFIQEFANIIK